MGKEPSATDEHATHRGRSPLRVPRRIPGRIVLALLLLTAGWWAVGRVTAESRRLEVRHVAVEDAAGSVGGGAAGDGPMVRALEDEVEGSGSEGAGRIRVLTWNIAHGRGDVGYSLFRNFRGGGEETRLVRLFRIAQVIRSVDPDVVVLNEVDFQALWSGGVNQAEILARATGLRIWVEQRNHDLQLPFAVLEFGNALLTSIPLDTATWVRIPPHRWIEAAAVGAKSASMIRLDAPVGPLAVIPVHLDFRGTDTRMGAVPALERARERESAPLVLAGDFNAAPPAWPQTGDLADVPGVERTVVGALLDRGWRSPRTLGPPGPEAWTYPVPAADRAIDWVLVEPPLEVLEARVLGGTAGLSDHAPVLSVIQVPGPGTGG